MEDNTICHVDIRRQGIKIYLNMALMSPFISANDIGIPKQAGTRYNKAGCKIRHVHLNITLDRQAVK